MERELYALWQGVLSHDRLIRGFKVYSYIDHKNNTFTEAQLDNRRRSKKMSNWALDLQNYDLVRIWIRGEANILADAPSRAPWEATLAKHLPIPDMPVRDLVKMMYQDPGGLQLLVDQRLGALGVESEWAPLTSAVAEGPGLASASDLSPRVAVGDRTPDFGTRTPEFGVERVFGAREL